MCLSRVEHHRTLAVVGESGAGKSTLAKVIAGLERPTSGHVLVAGRPLVQRGGVASRVQMVFQQPGESLDPFSSIGRSVAEPMHGISGAEREGRVAALLSRVGIQPSHAERRPNRFSGGQLQRIVLARALAAEPDVLLCDEPTSALDVSVQAQIVNLLLELQAANGFACVLVTHDLALVRCPGGRGAGPAGRLTVELSVAEDFFRAPAAEYSRGLLEANRQQSLQACAGADACPRRGRGRCRRWRSGRGRAWERDDGSASGSDVTFITGTGSGMAGDRAAIRGGGRRRGGHGHGRRRAARTAERVRDAGGTALGAGAGRHRSGRRDRRGRGGGGQLGRIDVLVNNAGAGVDGDPREMDLRPGTRCCASNCTGTFLCMQAVLPGMLAGGRGVSSISHRSTASPASARSRTARRRPASSTSPGTSHPLRPTGRARQRHLPGHDPHADWAARIEARPDIVDRPLPGTPRGIGRAR